MSGGFADLGLQQELLNAIEDLGWLLPTDIQDEAIPLILGGGDVMGAAETGSGKTAAFALPIIQSVHERLRSILSGKKGAPTASKGQSSEVSKPEIKLNSADKEEGITLSANGMECSHSGTEWVGVRATHGINRGKFYYEVEVLDKGNCRVGWSTIAAHLELGKDGQGFGYGGKGWKSFNGQYEKYGEEYTQGDFVGCYIDLSSRQIFFSKNGHLFESAFEIPEAINGTVLFPTIALSNSAVSINFGEQKFRYSPIAGYLPIAKSFHLFDMNAEETYLTRGPRKPLAIVIEPTRDLAEQVYQSFLDLSKYIDTPKLSIQLLIGDNTQSKFQKHQDVDIIVGTVGKITGLLLNHTLDLSQIRFFVLDEADKLVNAENLTAIKQIYSKCPGGGVGIHRLQVCFFSATLHSPAIQELTSLICINPTWIDLKGHEIMPETVHHVIVKVPLLSDSDYTSYLQRVSSQGQRPITDEVHTNADLALLNQQSPSNKLEEVEKCRASQRIKEMKPLILLELLEKYQMSQCMIFCRTNVDCQNLSRFLQQQSNTSTSTHQNQPPSSATATTAGGGSILVSKYSHRILGGVLSMEERRKNLQLFKENEIRLLICTDIASRGIDVDGLPYVINMTLPEEIDDYVHRVGRVGRSDRMGLAISLVADVSEKVWYHTCKNRGQNCTNRRLVEAGGCTVWYQEAILLAKIEKKLHQSILRMTPTLDLPEEIAKQNIVYGVSINKEEDREVKKIYLTENRKQTIQDLVQLEYETSNLFLRMISASSAFEIGE